MTTYDMIDVCKMMNTVLNVVLISICFKFCSDLELPELFPLNEVAKALLRVPNGPWFICRLLVNFPDYFEQGKCIA